MASKLSVWRTINSSIAVLLLLLNLVSSFEFNDYCSKMCMWGRGGNLCKCSAVHFAGKRNNNGQISQNENMRKVLEDVLRNMQQPTPNEDGPEMLAPPQAASSGSHDLLPDSREDENDSFNGLSDYRLNQLLRKFYKFRAVGSRNGAVNDGERYEDSAVEELNDAKDREASGSRMAHENEANMAAAGNFLERGNSPPRFSNYDSYEKRDDPADPQTVALFKEWMEGRN